MHGRGIQHRFEVMRAGSGVWTSLSWIPVYDAEHVPFFTITGTASAFSVGDRMRTTCTYASHGREVRWGYGGVDEMCSMAVKHFPYAAELEPCYGPGP
jgi:hypothetical protein